MAAWWSGLRRPPLEDTGWFNYLPPERSCVTARRVVVVETSGVDRRDALCRRLIVQATGPTLRSSGPRPTAARRQEIPSEAQSISVASVQTRNGPSAHPVHLVGNGDTRDRRTADVVVGHQIGGGNFAQHPDLMTDVDIFPPEPLTHNLRASSSRPQNEPRSGRTKVA